MDNVRKLIFVLMYHCHKFLDLIYRQAVMLTEDIFLILKMKYVIFTLTEADCVQNRAITFGDDLWTN
jgi:hypothetical protein